MSIDIGRHVPSPEFRASLEQEVVAAFHAPAPDGAPPSTRRRTRWRQRARAVALLVVGLFVGMGAQLASAQVQQERQRTELERSLDVERQLAAVRLELARENLTRARRSFEAGALSRQSLVEAEREMREQEVRAAQLELNLAEIRATAAAPRDELWAPLVGERDFVKERLQMEAHVAQQRLQAAESMADEVRRQFEVGAAAESSLQDAQLDVSEAKMRFQLLATRLNLRRAHVEENLSREEIARRERRAQVMFEIEHMLQRSRVAEDQVRRARNGVGAGAMDSLVLKRAELEMLELRARLQVLQRRLQAERDAAGTRTPL